MVKNVPGSETRCWWCGQRLDGAPRHVQVQVSSKRFDAWMCSSDHEKAVVKTYAYVQRMFPLFWIGISLSISLFVASNFFRKPGWFVVAGLAVMGFTLALCPFVTPQTIQTLGLRRGQMIGRMVGILFLIASLGLGVAMLQG